MISTENNDKYSIQIKTLGIYELRAVARSLGISSPTTKKRAQLIDMILENMQNGLVIETPPLKQGRPYKKLKNIDDILDSLKESTYENINDKTKTFEDIVQFNQEFPIIKDTEIEIPAHIKGVVRQSYNEKIILDLSSNLTVFIKDKVFYNKVVEGDYVEGEAVIINKSNQAILESISKINNVNIDEYISVYNDNQTIKLPNVEDTFGDKNIIKGTNNVIECKLNLNNYKDFLKLFNSSNDATYVLVGCNLSLEEKLMLQEVKDAYKFLGDYNYTPNQSLNLVLDAISFIGRAEKANKNLVVCFYNIITYANICDLCFKSDILPSYNHVDESMILIKKLSNLAKATTDNRTTTVISTYQDIDINDNCFKNEVYRISYKLEI